MAASGGYWKGGNFVAAGQPAGVSDGTIDTADSAISRIESRLSELENQRRNTVFASNPGMDTGGIRSRSERARDRNTDRVLSIAANQRRLIEDRNTLRALKNNYSKANDRLTAARGVLNNGTLKGKPLDSRSRREIQRIADRAEKDISRMQQSINSISKRN